MDKIELGKKLTKLRKDHKMTQVELANILNISDRTISKWENGTSAPDLEVIKKICEIYEIQVDSLMGEDAVLKKISIMKYLVLFVNFVLSHIFTILFAIAFIFLLIFFASNYNSVKVYSIKNDDNDSILVRKGYFVESKVKNILTITDVEIYNIDYDSVIISTKLYVINNGEKICFYESDNLNSIFIEDFSSNEEIFTDEIINGMKKGIYLSVDILDSKDKNHHYETKLDFTKSFATNKLMYIEKKTYMDNSDTDSNNVILNEVILLNNGFTKDEETGYYKRNKDIKIAFDLSKDMMLIENNTNKISELYYLYYNNSYMIYHKFDKNGKTINKYYYLYTDDELICYQGDCSAHKENTEYALKVLKSIK